MTSNQEKSATDSAKHVDVNPRIIQSNRIKRLQILDYLWKMKRTREISHVQSHDIMDVLKTNEINEIHFHLDILMNLGYFFHKIQGIRSGSGQQGIPLMSHLTCHL